jgi:hypothetical protein
MGCGQELRVDVGASSGMHQAPVLILRQSLPPGQVCLDRLDLALRHRYGVRQVVNDLPIAVEFARPLDPVLPVGSDRSFRCTAACSISRPRAIWLRDRALNPCCRRKQPLRNPQRFDVGSGLSPHIWGSTFGSLPRPRVWLSIRAAWRRLPRRKPGQGREARKLE